MGSKKMYHSNDRADHSSVNQNQLSAPVIPSSMNKTSSSMSIIEGLIVTNEQDLPFAPDTLESIITLLDLLIGIYRSLSNSLDGSGTLSKSDLSEIDLALASVEVVLRRTIITDGLAALDAEYLKRKVKRSKDVLEKDIILFSSQPNANAPKKPNYLGKIDNKPITTAMPQSHAMYV